MKNRDMTRGNIWKQLVLFAIPLLLGNVLQQLYNAFDAIVVGNYVGKEALAAVGASGPLINMIIAFFMGMSTGASVLISQHFGARDHGSLHDTVHTGILLAAVMGVILSAIGAVVSPALLRMMSTPEEIFAQANEYLRIFFLGMTALTIYNMGAATLTAIGDSRRPLYFLAISAIFNITLNLVFVRVFHMGIAGVAWSTVIAEAVSAILVIAVLCRAKGEHKLVLRDLRIHGAIFKGIALIGLPAGVQQAVISFSNILVQAYINGLGADVVAGYSACSKLDAFIMLPANTMALAVTTFVGQNLGAHQVDRARKGTRCSVMMGLSVTVALSVVTLLLGRVFLRAFSPDPDVLDIAMQFVYLFVPGYFILCFTQILPGALRGAGDVRTATIVCITSFVFVRQLYLFLITKVWYNLASVSLSYPLTWLLAAVALTLYYRRSDWSRFAAQGETTTV